MSAIWKDRRSPSEEEERPSVHLEDPDEGQESWWACLMLAALALWMLRYVLAVVLFYWRASS